MKKIIIGTRGSQLALKQTDIVANALKSIDPKIEIQIKIIQTHGDTNDQPIPLDTIGKGWFTYEIEQALLSGEIDIAVHSLKDMAEEMPEGLMISAYLAREDARDVLITKHGEPLESLKPGSIVGTDSTRRRMQVLALRPDLHVKSLRGNVPTRLEKLASENYDAIILASAGLKRLGLEAKITRHFDIHEITPAPGQGTLAIQTRKENQELNALLARINDADTAHLARIERSFSAVIGGGCKAPTGAYAVRDGNTAILMVMVANKNGTILREKMSALWKESQQLGAMLAKKIMETEEL